MDPEIDLLVTDATLGECPTWSVLESVLYWEDIDERRIHRFDPSTGASTACTLPGRPGSFALTDQPGLLLVAMEHDLVWLSWAEGEVAPRPWVTLEDGPARVRLNDGRCAPGGRFVVGSMWEEVNDHRYEGSQYLVEADGSFAVLRRGVGVANGSAFSPDHRTMYWTDTFTQKVLASDYDPASGRLANERVFLDYEPLPGFPDGACVDSDGCYWSASVEAGAVLRVTPTGAIDRRIELPVTMPSMPAFGGADLSTLYVTSIAAKDGTPGGLLAIDGAALGVQGLPEPLFASAGA